MPANLPPNGQQTEDELTQKLAAWMGFVVAILGGISYQIFLWSSLDLSPQDKTVMEILSLLVSTIGTLFIGWKPTHYADDDD